MIGQEPSSSYQELSDDVEHIAVNARPSEEQEHDLEDTGSTILPVLDNGASVHFSKSCLKNVFSVILLFIYLLLMAVAIFLVYQTITDFREKLKHPVMSVSYKEVSTYDAPGIALYPGKAELLTCKHHYYDYIPPLENPGQPGEIECTTQRISYTDPFTNQTKKHAVVVEGPRDVKTRELVFMQFHLNETDQDFSAIDYLLFSSFREFLNRTSPEAVPIPPAVRQLVGTITSVQEPVFKINLLTLKLGHGGAELDAARVQRVLFHPSPNKSEFMKECESSYSSWKFSGGFRTWVKMSLVKTKEDSSETVEFRQEISVVNYIDRRKNSGGDQLFFVVFEWKDPFIQEVQDIITANPWNMIALLCGIFLAMFKAADFAKLSVKWMIKIRKRHLKRRSQALNHIS